MATGKRRDVAERFWAKVDADGDCWEWRGYRNKAGYGSFGVAAGATWLAHRFAYTELVGPIGDGLQIDHLCRNRGCVNPDHLEPVTQTENLARGYGVSVLSSSRKRSEVIHGLAYTYQKGCRCQECKDAGRAYRQTLKVGKPTEEKPPPAVKKCAFCDIEFTPRRDATHCSSKCRSAEFRAKNRPPGGRRALVTTWYIEPPLPQ